MVRRILTAGVLVGILDGLFAIALYGIVVWLVMDLIVIPMTRTRPTPVTARSFVPALIGHMFVVGLPIALVIRPQTGGR